MNKVFVSGTYKDLKDYRDAVRIQLNRMQESHEISMEFMGASDKDPTTLSLEELDQCQVYLGIIGHRYGTMLPGDNCSITQREYERAFELLQRGKMRLLVYLADENVQISRVFRESDSLDKKLQDFRNLLQGRHTAQPFSSVSDLASRVSVDLPRLLNELPSSNPLEFKIFDTTSLQRVCEEIDTASAERLDKIEHFLVSTAEKFSSLFKLSYRELDIHPFFKTVKERLTSLIPGLSLDPKDGLLMRAKVRHVILRTETLLPIMQLLADDKLREVGIKVGSGAAHDLIEHTLSPKRYIPASPEVFVALWNFWDHTGGWGKLELLKYDRAPIPKWRIKVSNNFLAVKDDLAETHRLCEFWCGYIQGFLDSGLTALSELIAKLEGDKYKEVTLPAYVTVETVRHETDSEISADVFTVMFKEQRLSGCLDHLSNASYFLNKSDSKRAFKSCRDALDKAKHIIGDQWYKELAVVDSETKIFLGRLLESVEHAQITSDMAKESFNATNLFIKHLAQKYR